MPNKVFLKQLESFQFVLTQTLLHMQDMIQGQFLNGVKLVRIPSLKVFA